MLVPANTRNDFFSIVSIFMIENIFVVLLLSLRCSVGAGGGFLSGHPAHAAEVRDEHLVVASAVDVESVP